MANQTVPLMGSTSVLDASNGKSESMNSRIQKVKARSHGFRNKDRFRNAIYFHPGDFNLYPGYKRGCLMAATHPDS